MLVLWVRQARTQTHQDLKNNLHADYLRALHRSGVLKNATHVHILIHNEFTIIHLIVMAVNLQSDAYMYV